MVKAKYACGQGRGSRSQAAVRYYFLRPEGGAAIGDGAMSRPGEDRMARDLVLLDASALSGSRIRSGFDRASDSIGYTEARQQALHHPATYHYRLALSPDPEWSRRMTEGELRQWARDMLAPLERNWRVQWTAVVHQHPLHPHVHALVYSDARLSRDDLHQMRQEGNQALREWLREWKDLHTETIYGQTLGHKDPKPQGGGPALEGGEDSSGAGRNRKLKMQKGMDQSL